MALGLRYYNLVMKISTIDEKWPGGWSQFLNDHKEAVGRVIWFDDHLCRVDGDMNPNGMLEKLKWWEERGFIGLREGTKVEVPIRQHHAPNEMAYGWIMRFLFPNLKRRIGAARSLERQSQREWVDMCCLQSGFGSDHHCEWLDVDVDRGTAHLVGSAPGIVRTAESMLLPAIGSPLWRLLWARLESALATNELPSSNGTSVRCEPVDFTLEAAYGFPECGAASVAGFRCLATGDWLWVENDGSIKVKSGRKFAISPFSRWHSEQATLKADKERQTN